MTDPRVLTPGRVEDDAQDESLRPRRLDDYVGQDRIREQLHVAIWGKNSEIEYRSVDQVVKRLRKHLEGAAGARDLVKTVRDTGYRINLAP